MVEGVGAVAGSWSWGLSCRVSPCSWISELRRQGTRLLVLCLGAFVRVRPRNSSSSHDGSWLEYI